MSVSLTFDELFWSDVTFVRGELPYTFFSIINSGDTDVTEPFTSELYLSFDNIIDENDYLISSITLDGLSAGELSEDVFSQNPVPLNIAPGDYYVILSVDVNEQIIERDRDNFFFSGGLSPPIVIEGDPVGNFIDFGPSFGAPSSEVQLTDQLADYGVIFSSTSPDGVLWLGEDPAIGSYSYVFSAGWEDTGFGSIAPITIDFVDPDTGLNATVSDFSVRAFDGGGDNDILTVTGYDADGAVVNSATFGPSPFTSPGQTISISGSGIDYVVLETSGTFSGLFFDDVSFTIDGVLPEEPDTPSFEFNVFTAMQLATAAYAPIEDVPKAPDTGDRLMETSIYLSLFDESTTLRPVKEYFDTDGNLITDSNGFYINENAAALVAAADDSLIISFRGTNDNEDTYRNIGEALFSTDKAGPQATGLAGLQGLSKAKGKGAGLEKSREDAVGRAIPDDIQSPDVEDWLDLESHWELFEELWASIPTLLADYGIENIYLTGHSLGGSMVQWAFDSAEGAVDTSIKDAYTFGAPGLENWKSSVEPEARLLNIGFENDWVFAANYITSRVGDLLTIDTDGTGEHDAASYLEATSTLLETGFVKGDRLSSPENPGSEFGPQMERMALSLEGEGLTILKDSLQDGVFGTSGNDDITVSMDLFRDGGFVVVGREGNDSIDLSSGEDFLVFREGDGQDSVEDFNLSEDWLVLYGIAGLFDPPEEESGDFPFTSDTTVNFRNGDSIKFKGLDRDDVEFLLENRVMPADFYDPLLMA